MIPVSFPGGFPLQEPRMLVRSIRTCFYKQGGCGNDDKYIRPYFGDGFF